MTARADRADAAAAATARPLLEVADVDVVLGRGWRASHVLSGVDLTVWPGEIVGLVGETGSGKTTLARTVVGLVRPRGGRVVLRRHARSPGCAAARAGAERRAGHVQLVFQDPLRSLDPDLTVARDRRRGAADPRRPDAARDRRRGSMDALRQGRPRRGAAATARPARSPAASGSGSPSPGRWRPSPRLLLCDEPVSALDASNRNYILRLLAELRDSLGLPIVIISHDLSSLAGIADRVVVLYRGRIVEDGPVEPGVHRAAAPLHRAADGLGAPSRAQPATGALSVHQLRRTTADPAPPAGRRRVRVRRPLPVRDRRVRRPAAARAGTPTRRRPAGAPPATGTSEWPALAAAGRAAATALARPASTKSPAASGRITSMPVEFIGMIGTKDQSETRLAARPGHRPRLRPRGSPAPTRTPASTGC